MKWSSAENKYLIVRPTVILTEIIDYSIKEVDIFFKDCPSFVTSGLRNPERQLEVIRDYLRIKKLDKAYPEAMVCNVNDTIKVDGKILYVWQKAWSNLLAVKVIINPPFRAECLMDYFNSAGVNRKGSFINQTPHASGIAFNIGGGSNGPKDEAQCMQAAINAKAKSIVSFLLERENNAVHVNCKKAV